MEVLALERTLTELDHVRLLNLLRRDRRGEGSSTTRPAIAQVLDACAIVPSRQAPPDLVTMYSQVLLKDLETGRLSKLSPCYPADAEPAAGFVSVLSPVGASLLGLSVGAVARWSTPAGEEGAAELVDILFQPEASGDYAL
ncbi:MULTISPECIES: GreA/GreB family elongation factor [unclassified Rhizobacter]|uniref:GreA/GreB family elongation factor n=1 Tax=unclassified Rhizobacter TaxID=2640088 RepID=UPI0006F42431|nr:MULTISPECIES: GreA/GreB family elongation factor [unclassified Rhizobacter]KQU75519.1 transcription elongation factor GreAB [Rhizobacter sp. Root29]KQW06906.1 transcription elongation factor GreAB [Rhizobacter sp. Root1238]KRB18974.1 transcription elongation factor GreAB [Rhizobacter sp. Root16D2]